VTTIASMAFEGSGVTSVTGVDCAICDSLLIHRGTIKITLVHHRRSSFRAMFARLDINNLRGSTLSWI
jgi:hypothetical protein